MELAVQLVPVSRRSAELMKAAIFVERRPDVEEDGMVVAVDLVGDDQVRDKVADGGSGCDDVQEGPIGVVSSREVGELGVVEHHVFGPVEELNELDARLAVGICAPLLVAGVEVADDDQVRIPGSKVEEHVRVQDPVWRAVVGQNEEV